MQGSFAQPTRSNGAAIAIVLLMHGAAIGALALSKMEVIKERFTPIKVIPIKAPPPPEVPPPPEPKPRTNVEPQHVTRIFVPEPIIKPPLQQPTVDASPEPVIEPVRWTPPSPIEAPKLPDPPPPEPKKVESARAKANLASYVSDSDYPAAAIRSEEQGTTRFRLTVGANGRVSDCIITGTSGSSALDSATCRIMKQRARFTPARDSAGNPTRDTVANAIRWVLPE